MLDILRQVNPNLIYVCDPVMGDEGKLYVAQENVAVFRRIIPRADYLFPNQTEAEYETFGVCVCGFCVESLLH